MKTKQTSKEKQRALAERVKLYDPNDDWLDDGFQLHDPICHNCNAKTMQIVRPGKIQCYKCGG